jgi:polar amino acid transport system substrate-binding protein
MGKSMIVEGNTVTGIYPTLLLELTEKEDCPVKFVPVPHARAMAMFEAGRADLLFPAFKTAYRDQFGEFVALIKSRATLISLKSERTTIKSLQQIIDMPTMRLALVRGFDYGTQYQQLINTLSKLGRIVLESDATSVARLMKSGQCQATIMTPALFFGAIHDDNRVSELIEQLRFEPLDELPWGDSGVYISYKSLHQEDAEQLKKILSRATSTDILWKIYHRYYPAFILKESIQPLDARNP